MSDEVPQSTRAGALSRRRIETVDATYPLTVTRRRDALVTEEPLEIRVRSRGTAHPVAITMRTPGADFELAAGFLFGEGLLDDASDIARIRYCTGISTGAALTYNAVDVVLRDSAELDKDRTGRNFYAASSCGVCGKGSVEAVLATIQGKVGPGPFLSAEGLIGLPAVLEERQRLFARTGGLHAAALFAETGELLSVHEDIGRHNAVDKVIGAAWLTGRTPLTDRVLLVSGRISFEVVQKCARAGVSFVAGVSAPSSLAVELAESFGMTVVGFLRARRFNLYCGRQRLRDLPAT